MAPGEPWYRGRFVRTSLPMFGFVVLCWYGMEQLMTSKLKIRQSVRGYDKVEEFDPLERLRRLDRGGGGGGGGGGDTGGGETGSGGGNGSGGGGSGQAAAARGRRPAPPAAPAAAAAAAAAAAGTAPAGDAALEAELAAMLRGVDLRDFENRPVPRPADDEW